MTEQKRQLMLEVMDGFPPNATLLYHLNSFTRCEQILLWLIKNRVTGKNLFEFHKVQFQGSILNMAKEILRRIDHNQELKPILVGKDFIPNR